MHPRRILFFSVTYIPTTSQIKYCVPYILCVLLCGGNDFTNMGQLYILKKKTIKKKSSQYNLK